MQAYASPALRAAVVGQQRANRSTADQWERFAPHRAQVTGLLLEAAAGKASPALCVLGAGNCNDIDLAHLASVYEHVDLVDLDARALRAALARLSPEGRAKVVSHAPFDVSGVLDRLPQWRRMNTSERELVEFPGLHAQRVAGKLRRSFDCVVSCGLLTQLQLPIVETLGAQHPLFEAATRTLQLAHLRVLHALTAAGGSALLVTEVTSNLTLPALDAAPNAAELAEQFEAVVRSGNLIRVADPVGLRAIMADDPLLRELAVSEPAPAWHWQQGPERSFLTYALRLQR